jgi:hypothetical protein
MRSKFFLILVLVFSLFTLNFAQTNGLPKLKKDGENYKSVRAKMLKAGWKSAATADSDKCSKNDSRCQGRPEMEFCAGTGWANCAFRWKRKNKIVLIFTLGENTVYSGYRFEK